MSICESYGRYKRLRPAGFEPAAYALGKRCSIQLSYERNVSSVATEGYSEKNFPVAWK